MLEAATPRAPGAALRLIGSGSGGVTELASHLSQDNLFYGFVRTTEAIDRYVINQMRVGYPWAHKCVLLYPHFICDIFLS